MTKISLPISILKKTEPDASAIWLTWSKNIQNTVKSITGQEIDRTQDRILNK